MLIKTPERELEFFARARKSDKLKNFPSFLNFGFRNNSYFAYGFAIAAAIK